MSEQRTIDACRRKLGLWHVLLIVLCLAIIAFGAFRVAVHVRVRSRINAIGRAGYPVTLSQLDESYAMPPFAENAADRITEAFAQIQLPEGQAKERIPLLGRAQLPPRGQRPDENTTLLTGELLRDNEAALRLLREGAAMPHCRYPIDLTEGLALELPHLKHFKDAAGLLCLEAVWCAEHGDAERATDAIATSLKVADTLAEEPVIISQLVRQSCKSRTVSTLEAVLNRTSPTGERLSALQEALAASYDPNATARALAGERCFCNAVFRNPTAPGLSTVSPSRPAAILVACARAVGLLDVSWAIYLDLMDESIRAAQLEPWRRQEAAEVVQAQAEEVHKIHVMVHTLMPAGARVVTIGVANLARLQTARTAVAVERYRLTNGRLPERLPDLVPEYLPCIPPDPFDGAPLRYQKRENGFVVYSVGEDRQDDEGKERPPKRRGSDPQPRYDITFIVER